MLATNDKQLRTPAAWDSFNDLVENEAGRAYILDQLDHHSDAITPEHSFQSDKENGDSAWYEVYDDGSLWFINNAEDEVWSSYRDFVQDCLLGAIHSEGACWTKEEHLTSENGWKIDDMDKQLLLLYCDGDEQEARELIGL